MSGEGEKQKKSARLLRAEKRIEFLADRMAVLLVVCKQRHGGDWNPWFREGTYDDEGSLGDEIREWPEFAGALDIVRIMLKKHDKREREDGWNVTDTINAEITAQAGVHGGGS